VFEALSRTLLWGLQFEDPTPETDGDRMGAIISTKLGEDAFNVTFDSLLRDRKLIGDYLVRIAGCDQ
jgi:hypothetical protein